MINRHLLIRNTHPTVVTISGNSDATDNDGNAVVLDESLITAEETRLQTEYDAKQYQRDRLTEYPPIGDQLDMLWHSIDESPELKTKYFKFYEACKAIKVKYPK